MKLLIAPGIHRREGWMALDADPSLGTEFTAIVPPLPASVKAIAWDEIEWVHGITSLYPWDAESIVREIHGVMRPGGKLTLEQPDFNKAKEHLEWIFGDAAEFRKPLLMNRWAYTPESLSKLLLSAGFMQIATMAALHHRPERDFRIEAIA